MKRRMEENNSCASSEQDQNKLMKIEKDRRSWHLIPILSDEYCQEIDKELVYVAQILDKKEASHLVKEMSQAYPIPSLMHLKRVRCRKIEGLEIMDIILLPINEVGKAFNDHLQSKAAISAILPKKNVNLQGLAEYGTIVAVPKTSPLTRKQYKAAMELWPTQFHEDKYTAKVLNDKVFNEEDKDRIEFYMRKAIESAEKTHTPVGAVIVDSSSNTIISKAVDLRRKHPLQHAAMVAIDLVSKSQGGGAWNFNAPQLYSAQKEENYEENSKSKSGPYLCTGYDIYLTREPCTMCAMALVHCRIRRVFYGFSTPWGKLGTCMKLHTQKGLNHHFEVWKGVLEKECIALSEKYDMR